MVRGRASGRGDDAELVAVAEEILGLDGFDALPYPSKRHFCGIDDGEVRRYLGDVAAQFGTKAAVSAHADGRLGSPA